MVSICQSDDWEKHSLPRVEDVVPTNWFEPLTIINEDILVIDYEKILADQQRVLLFWDAHGYDVAGCVLGSVLPLLENREHLVIMHDIVDNRYFRNDIFDYKGEPIWQRSPEMEGPFLCLGNYSSMQEQLVSILDFTTRNKITLHSADHSFHTELGQDREKVAELNQLLGEPFFSLNGYWCWFSLNEKEGSLFFPRYESPTKEIARSTASAIESFEDRSEPPELARGIEENADERYTDEIFAAEAYWKKRQRLAAESGRIKELYHSIGNEVLLSPFQWTQFIAFALEFNPDLIIEIGRWEGNSTILFNETVGLLLPKQARLLSVWPSEALKETLDKIRHIIPGEWFERLTPHYHDVFTFPYKDHIGDARRVLVYLDENTFEMAEWFLGKFMPLIADRNHVVLVHDISDSRYYPPQLIKYSGDKLWQTKTSKEAGLIIGNVASRTELALSLLDFTSRNGITLFSGDHSLHSAFDNNSEKVEEMRALLGPEFFATQAHWRWFSLNETLEEPTFPELRGQSNC